MVAWYVNSIRPTLSIHIQSKSSLFPVRGGHSYERERKAERERERERDREREDKRNPKRSQRLSRKYENLKRKLVGPISLIYCRLGQLVLNLVFLLLIKM